MALVFANRVSDPLMNLVRQLDKAIAESKPADLRGWFVFLTRDRVADEPKLDDLAKKFAIGNMPFTIYENPAGPPNYRIHRAAEVTVMFYVERKVTANYAFRRGELNDARVKEMVSNLAKMQATK